MTVSGAQEETRLEHSLVCFLDAVYHSHLSFFFFHSENDYDYYLLSRPRLSLELPHSITRTQKAYFPLSSTIVITVSPEAALLP